jgi:iron complex outermembrane receptor protein
LLLCASVVTAREGSGRIEGHVTRDDGSAIAGVGVAIDGTSAITLTDDKGNFAFKSVRPGTYTLTFTLLDNVVTESDVSVTAGSTTVVHHTVDWEVSFVETVTVHSVSRRRERIVEAPAAVSTVTEEAIERQASHGQVPKLIEFTPGAEITQGALYEFNVSTRGFNNVLNRRTAWLIDGRDASDPFIGFLEWATLSSPLDDLASVELIRGPSAALYGPNASGGVLNLVTKQPRYSQGGQVRLTAGELETTHVDFRWAGDLGGDWYMKAVGGMRDSGDFAVSRTTSAEYSVLCQGDPGTESDCLVREALPLQREDDDEITIGGLRFDKYLSNGSVFTIEGGTADIAGPTYLTTVGRAQTRDLTRSWARSNYSAKHWNVLAYYNERDADVWNLGPGTKFILDADNVQVELQTNWDFADNKVRLVGGGSFGEENIDTLDPSTGEQTAIYRPVETETKALFAQADWRINDHLKLVAAARWDDSTLHDSQLSPKASAVYSVNPRHSLRFTYNEAFQVATYPELFLYFFLADIPTDDLEAICQAAGSTCGLGGTTPALALGNEDLDLEEIATFEVGYSGILGSRAFLTVDFYRSKNENFFTDLVPQLGPPWGQVNEDYGPWVPPPEYADDVPQDVVDDVRAEAPSILPPGWQLTNLDGENIILGFSLANFGEVDTQGVDVGLNYYFDERWCLSFAGSWFDFDVVEDLPDEVLPQPNAPEYKAAVGLSYAGQRWDAGLNARWVDDFRWSTGWYRGDVDSYTTVDLHGNFVLNDHWKVGVNVANLFDNEHWEAFGGDLIGRRALVHTTFAW